MESTSKRGISKQTLIGAREICQYLGVSRTALDNWRAKEGFPVASLPDGRLMTTPTLIDAWLFARSEVTRARRNEKKRNTAEVGNADSDSASSEE